MKIFVSAGDYSADLYAGELIKNIKAREPLARVISFGGKYLKQASDEFAFDLVSASVSGFLEPLFKLGSIIGAVRKAEEIIRGADALLLVDYYGFNIRLAQYAFKRNIPVYYFISPQIWASRYGRIKKLKAFVKKMFVIFPFEEKIYSGEGVPVKFAGHPMSAHAAEIKNHRYPENGLRIGVLPGSRRAEVQNHAGTLLEAAAKFSAKHRGAEFYFFISANTEEKQLESLGIGRSGNCKIVREQGFETRKTMNLCWCCSGTAVLENAFFGIPTICFYKMSPLNFFLAKAIVNVKYIAMPNILSGTEVVPELIQNNFNADSLLRLTAELLENRRKLMDNSNKLKALTSGLLVDDFYGSLAEDILREIAALRGK